MPFKQTLPKFLLISFVIAIFSCSKEDFNYTSNNNNNFELIEVQEEFEINNGNLKDVPLWNDAQSFFRNGKKYFDIPLTDIQKINLNKSTSISFDRIIAYKNANQKIQLKIIHYFILNKIHDYKELKNFNYNNLLNYDGFITERDMNNNVEDVKKISNGKRINHHFKIKELIPSKNMPEDCTTSTETITTQNTLFWIYNDGTTEVITTWYTTETYSYESCEYSGGGGGGSGGETFKEEEIEVEIVTVDLDEKSKCVLEQLQKTSNGFKSALHQFDMGFEIEYLIFESEAFTLAHNAKTLKPDNYSITMVMNTNTLNRPNISIARTLIHETLHAEMYRQVMNIMDNGGDLDGMTRSEWKNKLENGDPDIYNYYVKYGDHGFNEMHHEQIADKYITTISSYLAEYQPGFASSIYESMAWEGLMLTDAWKALDPEKQEQIKAEIIMIDNIGEENCENL